MKLAISYAKKELNGALKPIGNYKYEIYLDTFDRGNATEIIKSIMDLYGDDTLDYYIEKDADVFACYLNDETEPTYVSEKELKKDPISIVDGFIRRYEVSSVVLTYDKLVYMLETPKMDSVNKNNIIVSNYNVNLLKDNGEKHALKGDKITIFFPYRDGKYSDIPNKKCADNTIPFFYVLNGKLHEERFYPSYFEIDEITGEDYGYYEYTDITDTEIKDMRIKVVPYYDSVIYVMAGKFKEKDGSGFNNEECNGEYEGFYFSMNEEYVINGKKRLNYYAWLSAYKEICGCPQDECMRIKDSRLEEIIKCGKYEIINSAKTMELDLAKCLNAAMCKSGIAMARGFILDSEMVTSNNLQCLSYEQSRILFDIFSYEEEGTRNYRCSLKDIYNLTEKILGESTNYDFDEHGMSEDAFNLIIDKLSSAVSCSMKNKEDKQKTAIHEMGHAVVGNLLAPEHKDLWEKVTVVSNSGEGYAGCCFYYDDKYNLLLDTVDKKVMVSLGGMIAEELCLKDNSSGWSQDYLECKGQINEKLLSDNIEFVFDEINGKIKCKMGNVTYFANDIRDQILAKIIEQTRELLSNEKSHIEELAKRILQTNEKEIDGKTFDNWYKEICG